MLHDIENSVIFCDFKDEEIGGALGMKKFVQSDVFKAMNVGVALDEGEILRVIA